MIAAFVAIIIVVLVILNFYTKHNESVSVPLVKGMLEQEAADILRSSGLKYEVIDSVYQTGGVPGSITEQIPKENLNVKRGRTVFLVVQAKGVELVAIPELKDYSRRQAEAQLNSLGFTKIIIEEVPATYKGLVISVSYKGQKIVSGQKIPKGATLNLLVGAGGESLDGDSIDSQVETQNVENSFFE